MKRYGPHLTMVAILVWLFATAIVGAALDEPCPAEDAWNCSWNAAERGNGSGRSFTNILGIVIYWED